MVMSSATRTLQSRRVRSLAQIASIMGECLREPPPRALHLARQTVLRCERASRETNRCLARLAVGQPHGLACTRAERERLLAFANYVREEPRPKVVIGIHRDNFLLDAIKALELLPRDIRISVPIPARSATALGPLHRYAVSQAIRLELPTIKAGASTSMRALRNADLLFLLFDLGRDYGRTIETSLFGSPAFLVAGPYVLARRLRASIVYFDRDSHGMLFRGPFDECSASPPPTLDSLACRFIGRMEAGLVQDPTSWSRWHTMPALRKTDTTTSC